MPRKDALDDLDFLDALEGWSLNEMARTVGKMIRGADNVAVALSLEAAASPVDTMRVQQLAVAMKNVSNAIESYAGLYTWCVAQGQTGRQRASALEELLPLLDVQETRLLQTWLRRLEVHA